LKESLYVITNLPATGVDNLLLPSYKWFNELPPDRDTRQFFAIFTSWNDFLAVAVHGQPNSPHAASRKGDREFTHTDTFDEAVNLALYGWPQGVEAYNAAQEYLNLRWRKGVARKTVLKTQGHAPSIPHFVAGDAQHMETYERAPSDWHKRLNLIVPTVIPGAITADQIIAYGITVTRIIDECEASGCPTGVQILFKLDLSRGHRLSVLVNLKNEEAQLPVSMLLFALAHPSTLRRLYFAIYERLPMNNFDASSILDSSYGYVRPYALTEEYRESMRVRDLFSDDTIILPEAGFIIQKGANTIPKILDVMAKALPTEVTEMCGMSSEQADPSFDVDAPPRPFEVDPESAPRTFKGRAPSPKPTEPTPEESEEEISDEDLPEPTDGWGKTSDSGNPFPFDED
jgi:hypothetical protein